MNLTKDHGQLFLLKNDVPGDYPNDIKIGDKLLAASEVNFRKLPKPVEPEGTDSVLFVLETYSCVIVIDEPKNPVIVKNARSGGWLHVATTPCGLFN